MTSKEAKQSRALSDAIIKFITKKQEAIGFENEVIFSALTMVVTKFILHAANDKNRMAELHCKAVTLLVRVSEEGLDAAIAGLEQLIEEEAPTK